MDAMAWKAKVGVILTLGLLLRPPFCIEKASYIFVLLLNVEGF